MKKVYYPKILFCIQIWGQGREKKPWILKSKNKKSNILFIPKCSLLEWSLSSLQCLPELSQSLIIKMSLFKNLFSRGENWKDYGNWSHCRPRHLFRGKKMLKTSCQWLIQIHIIQSFFKTNPTNQLKDIPLTINLTS